MQSTKVLTTKILSLKRMLLTGVVGSENSVVLSKDVVIIAENCAQGTGDDVLRTLKGTEGIIDFIFVAVEVVAVFDDLF